MRYRAAEDDVASFSDADVGFYSAVAEISGDKRLERMWQGMKPQLWTLFSTTQLWTLFSTMRGLYSLPELAERHGPVLEAIRTRDPDRAEETMGRHIIEIAESVLQEIGADTDDPGFAKRFVLPGRPGVPGEADSD